MSTATPPSVAQEPLSHHEMDHAMVCDEPVALASRLPPEILLQIFKNVYQRCHETHHAPESSLFHPPSSSINHPSSPSGRMVPLLTVCRAWSRMALTVLYREPIVSLDACGKLAQTLSLGGAQGKEGIEQQLLLATNYFLQPKYPPPSSMSGVHADWSTHSAPKPWATPQLQRIRQDETEEKSPYYGMDWYWDPAGGCAQCRQAKRTQQKQQQQQQQQHQQLIYQRASVPTARGISGSCTSSSSSSSSSLWACGSVRPLPLDYRRLVKKPCRITGSRHVTKQDLTQLWDLQRVLAFASKTRLEDLPVTTKKKKKMATTRGGQGAVEDGRSPSPRSPPVLMVLETSTWFRESTDHVLENVVGLGLRQLNYHYSQPLKLADLAREHGQSVKELHLGRVDLALDDYVELARLLGQAQGELRFGHQDQGDADRSDDDMDMDMDVDKNERPVFQRSLSSTSVRSRQRGPHHRRTRLRALCLGSCRNTHPRSVLEAFAEHCGSGLELVELQGTSGAVGAAWPTVASLQPFPIPTEFSAPVRNSSTPLSQGVSRTDAGETTAAVARSALLAKSRFAPLVLLPQVDQEMLQARVRQRRKRSLSEEEHEDNEEGEEQPPATATATAPQQQDQQDQGAEEQQAAISLALLNADQAYEARVGEALVELGQRAPHLTSLRLSCAEGLWDGCLDLFRNPGQVEEVNGTAHLRPTIAWPQPNKGWSALLSTDAATTVGWSTSMPMPISPPTSPSPAASPTPPSIASWATASSPPLPASPPMSPSGIQSQQQQHYHEDDDGVDRAKAYFFAQRGFHPARKCGLRELMLTQCGHKSAFSPVGSRLTIPYLVQVCGSDLETLIVDRESCWQTGQADASSLSSSLMSETPTGDQILEGLLAPERQQTLRTRMTSLKNLLLLDHWVSATMIKRALEAWSFHLRVAQFLVLPCTLEALLDALTPSCSNPRLEVLMLSIVDESNVTEFKSLEPTEVQLFLQTVFTRFPQLRVVRLNHAAATWTRGEWEACL